MYPLKVPRVQIPDSPPSSQDTIDAKRVNPLKSSVLALFFVSKNSGFSVDPNFPGIQPTRIKIAKDKARTRKKIAKKYEKRSIFH